MRCTPEPPVSFGKKYPMKKYRVAFGSLIGALLAVAAGQDSRPAARGAEPPLPTKAPLVRSVDLAVGGTQTVELCDGKKVTVKLVELKETRDDIRAAVRSGCGRVARDRFKCDGGTK